MNTTVLNNRQMMETVVSTNRVIRNTFTLLAMTLAFSAVTSAISMTLNLPHPGILITLVGYFGLLFAVNHFRNSGLGLALVFALTGFMGATLGPISNIYTYAYANGTDLVMMAMGGTAVIFLAMSGLALTSKRDFSFMGKFLMVGILVAFLAAVGNIFFQFQPLALAVSSMFILLMCGLILFEAVARRSQALPSASFDSTPRPSK